MKDNMGFTDRLIRLVIAVLFIVLYYTNTITGLWGIALLVLAAIFVLTSFAGVCPLYSLLGINTCPRKSNQSKSQ